MVWALYRRFILWWVSILLLATGPVWAGYFGLINTIWVTDHTYITSIIAGIFIFRNLQIGWYTYKSIDEDWAYDNHDKLKKHKDSAWFMSGQILALGMLGTVIGMIHMLTSVSGPTGDSAQLQTMITGLFGAMGMALYTNAVGLFCSLVLKQQIKYICE